jgi:molybdopterin-binding protein
MTKWLHVSAINEPLSGQFCSIVLDINQRIIITSTITNSDKNDTRYSALKVTSQTDTASTQDVTK